MPDKRAVAKRSATAVNTFYRMVQLAVTMTASVATTQAIEHSPTTRTFMAMTLVCAAVACTAAVLLWTQRLPPQLSQQQPVTAGSAATSSNQGVAAALSVCLHTALCSFFFWRWNF